MTANAHKRGTVLLVGPLPPPPGGIALQSDLWVKQMRQDGWTVRTVASTRGESRVVGWPALLRRPVMVALWLGFIARLIRGLTGVNAVVIATSSWLTFHLKARPARALAHRLGKPVLIWYKGGDVANFLMASGPRVVDVLSCADRLAVPSGFIKEVFSAYGLEATVAPNVVDESLFVFRYRPMLPLRGLVARSLEPIYNNACAIRAWGLLRPRFPEAELWIAGTGPEEAALKALAEAVCPGGVRFLGAVSHDRMGEIFNQCTCLVNPTEVDNMPNAVLEAQAAGLPVVATRVGGTPLLIDHGRTGLLIERDNPEQLAQAVARLADDAELCRAIVRQARHAVRLYHWSAVGPTWHGLIQSMITENTELVGCQVKPKTAKMPLESKPTGKDRI